MEPHIGGHTQLLCNNLVYAISMSPTENRMVVQNSDIYSLWVSGSSVDKFVCIKTIDLSGSFSFKFKWSLDGEHLMILCKETFKIYDKNLNLKREIEIDEEFDNISEYILSPCGRFLALSICFEGSIEIRSLYDYDTILSKYEGFFRIYAGFPVGASSLSWHPSGRYISFITLEEDKYNQINIIDLTRGRYVLKYRLGEKHFLVPRTYWSPNGKYLLTACHCYSIRLFAFTDESRLTHITTIMTKNFDYRTRISWHPSGKLVTMVINDKLMHWYYPMQSLKDTPLGKYNGCMRRFGDLKNKTNHYAYLNWTFDGEKLCYFSSYYEDDSPKWQLLTWTPDRYERLAALDEATGKCIPEDLLRCVQGFI